MRLAKCRTSAKQSRLHFFAREVIQVGKYDPLRSYLESQSDRNVTLSFDQLERILGFELPASASRHRPWWANEREGQHSHARSWMGCGWRVSYVDLHARRVEFSK